MPAKKSRKLVKSKPDAGGQYILLPDKTLAPPDAPLPPSPHGQWAIDEETGQSVPLDKVAQDYAASRKGRPPASISAPPPPGSLEWLQQKKYAGLDWLIHRLPTIGGMAGGLIGGGAGTIAEPGGGTFLGATTGSFVGGSAGEALKQLVHRALFGHDPTVDPKSSITAAGDILKEGGLQAAYEAAGQGISRVARLGPLASRSAERARLPFPLLPSEAAGEEDMGFIERNLARDPIARHMFSNFRNKQSQMAEAEAEKAADRIMRFRTGPGALSEEESNRLGASLGLKPGEQGASTKAMESTYGQKAMRGPTREMLGRSVKDSINAFRYRELEKVSAQAREVSRLERELAMRKPITGFAGKDEASVARANLQKKLEGARATLDVLRKSFKSTQAIFKIKLIERLIGSEGVQEMGVRPAVSRTAPAASELVSDIIKDSSMADIRALTSLMPTNTRRLISLTIFRDLIDQSFKGAGGRFDAQAFNNAVKQVGDDKLSAIMGDQWKTAREFRDSIRFMGASGMPQALTAIRGTLEYGMHISPIGAAVVAALTGHPMVATGAAAAEAAQILLAKAITNPQAARWLSQGLRLGVTQTPRFMATLLNLLLSSDHQPADLPVTLPATGGLQARPSQFKSISDFLKRSSVPSLGAAELFTGGRK